MTFSGHRGVGVVEEELSLLFFQLDSWSVIIIITQYYYLVINKIEMKN